MAVSIKTGASSCGSAAGNVRGVNRRQAQYVMLAAASTHTKAVAILSVHLPANNVIKQL